MFSFRCFCISLDWWASTMFFIFVLSSILLMVRYVFFCFFLQYVAKSCEMSANFHLTI